MKDITKYKTGEHILIKGNEALAEGAVRAGCRFFSGYPITPQNEVPEYLSWRLFEVGGTFIQAEAEVSAINMLYGAAAVGTRAMTSSSGCGISLKQEGISYIASAELPIFYANVMRGGPGLGNISPYQGDYFQSTRGGGHGDYRVIVLAPNSVTEMGNFPYLGYKLADKYRIPCMVLADGLLGQMMEPMEFKFDWVDINKLPPKDYTLTGCKNRERRIINTLYMDVNILERHTWHLYQKYREIEATEVRYEERYTEDADIIVVAYGTSARVAMDAIAKARKQGIKVGLFRPITLWPFPKKRLLELTARSSKFLVVEMSIGQMVEDVELSLQGKAEIYFYGQPGGIVPTGDTIKNQISKIKPVSDVSDSGTQKLNSQSKVIYLNDI
ncbi:MAG: 3-methyl-2-oxobutanoate dehydrogenase subunit VorB [Candidatus Stahlbacteria bacterium]|nr:3-methyl-2-oxobutanoate dehydrogenase subunit VorB [Candidatus Stahlbacteria bacterium]